LAISAGFLVLVPSQFVVISQMGILVATDMMTISFSALTFLPACIKLFPPKIFKKTSDEYVAIDPLMEEPG
jgi:predicted RND superfamily exporter protein